LTQSSALSAHFVSLRPNAQNKQNEAIGFAKRKEAFRSEGRNPLRSLGSRISNFAESFVFNGLTLVSFRSFLASTLSVQIKPGEVATAFFQLTIIARISEIEKCFLVFFYQDFRRGSYGRWRLVGGERELWRL
jgi:hypothetical protein